MANLERQITGVATTDFTEEVWTGIAEAYIRAAHMPPLDAVIDSGYWYGITASRALDSFGELRLGSVITAHSKLIICSHARTALHFDFHANADPRELELAKKYEGITPAVIQADFDQRVTTFLGGLGIGRPITCP